MQKVLGVSGLPIPNSNTDRALKSVLEATGLETEFVKLSDYTVAPCKACLGCVKTNRCTIQDDGIILAEKVKAAAALVIAGFTPYATLESRTKACMERLYPLQHRKGFMAGKPDAAISTSAPPEGHEQMPEVAEMAVHAVAAYMMEEGMQFVGALKLRGNVPCVRCGFGDECHMSGVKMIYGSTATVDCMGINQFERQASHVERVRTLGQKIAEALCN